MSIIFSLLDQQGLLSNFLSLASVELCRLHQSSRGFLGQLACQQLALEVMPQELMNLNRSYCK